jgi:hypothetical protein
MTNNTEFTAEPTPEIKDMSCLQWLWKIAKTFIQSRLFTFGWFIINTHSSLVLLYNKSPLKKYITYIYNSITPNNSVEKIYMSDKFKFFIHTKDRKYKQIKYELVDEIDYSAIVPLEEAPFISVEIMIERNEPSKYRKNTENNTINYVEVYEMKFRTPAYDYYIENNEFNHDFIEWFMRHHYNVSIAGTYYTIHAMRRHDFENVIFVKGDTIILRNHLKK